MKKILFIDRDGTLIAEPFDQQIDRLDKFALEPDCVPALLRLRDAGWTFVMVTNQDGLGTPSFREEEFRPLQKLLLDILASQGIAFEAVRVCPHTAADKCDCRKPKLGLLMDYVKDVSWSREQSAVIGDRETDVTLAQNLGIRGIKGPCRQTLRKGRIGHEFGVAFPFQRGPTNWPLKMRCPRLRMRAAMAVKDRPKMRQIVVTVSVMRLHRLFDRHIMRRRRHLQRRKGPRVQFVDGRIAQGMVKIRHRSCPGPSRASSALAKKIHLFHSFIGMPSHTVPARRNLSPLA